MNKIILKFFVMLLLVWCQTLPALSQCTWEDVRKDQLKSIDHIFSDRFTGKIYGVGIDANTYQSGIYERVENSWMLRYPTNQFSIDDGYTFSADGTPYKAEHFIENYMLKYRVSIYKNSSWYVIYTGNTYTIDTASNFQVKKLKFIFKPTADPSIVYLGTYWGSGNNELTIGKIQNYEYTPLTGISQCFDCDFEVSPTTGELYVSALGTTLMHGAVKKFNGSTWEYVGGENITDGYQSGNPEITFSATGELFVAYTTNKELRMNVKRFDGYSWVFVGPRDFSAMDHFVRDIAISPDGTPFIVYLEVINDQFDKAKLALAAYSGGSWKKQSIITHWGEAENHNLFFGNEGDLFFTYDSLKYDSQKGTHTFLGRKLKTISPLLVTQSEETERPVCINGAETFKAEGKGKRLTYQWQMNEGTGYQTLQENEYFTGVNTPTLAVSKISASLQGKKIQCIVSNETCKDTSRSVTLITGTKRGIGLPGDTVVCKDYFIRLPVNALWFQWENTDAGKILSFTAEKNARYHISYKDKNGCSDTTSIHVTVKKSPVIDLEGPKDTFCINTQVRFKALTSEPSWKWSTGATTSEVLFTIESDTSIYVSTKTANGCTDTASIRIHPLTVGPVALSGDHPSGCLNNTQLFLNKFYPHNSIKWYKDEVLFKEQPGGFFQRVDSIHDPALNLGTSYTYFPDRTELFFIFYNRIYSYSFKTKSLKQIYSMEVPVEDPYDYRLHGLTYKGDDQIIFFSDDSRNGLLFHQLDLVTMKENTEKPDYYIWFASKHPGIYYARGDNSLIEQDYVNKTSREVLKISNSLSITYDAKQEKIFYIDRDLYSISLLGSDHTPVKDSLFYSEVFERNHIQQIYFRSTYTLEGNILFYATTHEGPTKLCLYNVNTHHLTFLNDQELHLGIINFESNPFLTNEFVIYSERSGFNLFYYNEKPSYVEVTEPGEYRAEVSGRCTESSNKINVYNVCTNVTTLEGNEEFNVYPNPGNGLFRTSVELFSGGRVEVYNLLGKNILNIVLKNGDNHLDLTDLESGNYILKFLTENQRYMTRKISIIRD